MPTGTNLTDGEVRSIFALRAEGKQIATIADTMGCATAVVSRVLARKTYSKVDISTNVLDAIAGHTFRSYKKRGAYKKKKKVKDTRPPAATLDDLNLDPIDGTKGGGVIQQAAKAATTDVGSGVTGNALAPKPSLAAKQGEGYVTRATSKADAMGRVLKLVEEGNEARVLIKEAKAKLANMEEGVKRTEDRAFAAITALTSLGFTPEFLNTFLTECGLCTDGLFSIK